MENEKLTFQFEGGFLGFEFFNISLPLSEYSSQG